MRRMFRIALVVCVGAFLLQLTAISQTGVTSASFVNTLRK
jgi:hypothetical protein